MIPFVMRPSPGLARPTASKAVSTVISTLPATGIRPRTSHNGQLLVNVTLARPGTIPTTGDQTAVMRAGCGPVAWWPPACQACPWGAGPSVHDHARGAWHAKLAGRRSRPADPQLREPSARLVAQADPGRGCHPRGRPTSHHRSSPPALAWPPGQGRRPRRPPRAAFVAPAPPSLHLLQAATKAGVSHWPARQGNHRDHRPGDRSSRRASSNGASLLEPGSGCGACAGGKSNHQQVQVITIAKARQRPRQAEEEQELSVHSNEGRPCEAACTAMATAGYAMA
jgi:hypothetical protein